MKFTTKRKELPRMEMVFEFLFELYLEFWTIFVPEHKFKKWQETLLKLACIFVSLIILVLIFAGISLLTETSMRTAGIVLLVVGSVLFIAHVILFIIVFIIQIKKERVAKLKQSDDCDLTK